MLLELDASLPEIQSLIHGVQAGSYCLFAGAGASIGATNSSGHSPPLTRDLIRVLLEAAEWPPDPSITLPQAYDAVRNVLGTEAVHEILKECYLGCTPGWQVLIPTFLWKRIYTVNIDDVLSLSYRRAGEKALQRFKLVNFDQGYEEPDDDEDLMGVHLHGFVGRADSGFIFGPTEYARAAHPGLVWHSIFSSDFFKYGFVFVGTTFSESDLESYLHARGAQQHEFRPPSFLVVPDANPVRAAAFASRGIHCIRSSADQFFAWLDQHTPNRLSRSAHFLREHPELQANGQYVQYYRTFDKCVRPVSDAMNRGPRMANHEFFAGDEPTWQDIFDDNDAVFDVVPAVLQYLDEVEAGRAAKADILCLRGIPGSGKTTALMRTALEASRRGRKVYYYESAYGLPVPALTHVLTKSPPYSVFIVDNAANHVTELFHLARNLRLAGHPIHLLTAERTTRYRRLEVEGTGCSIRVIEMSTLSDGNIAILLEKLRQKARLGKLREKDYAGQFAFFKSFAGRQLLVALKEATEGRSFSEILNGEYRSISPVEARRLYTTVALVHQTAVALGLPEMCQAARVSVDDAVQWLNGPLHAIVVQRGAGVATRHPVIAQHVVNKLCKAEDRIAQMIALLEALAPYLNVRRLRRLAPEALVMKRFIDYDFVRVMASDKEPLIDRFYQALQPRFDWNSKYWAQRGLFEGKRRKFLAAYDHTKAAVTMDPNNDNLVTHAWVLMEWAADRSLADDDGWAKFRGAVQILERVGSATSWEDEYPINTLLAGILSFSRVRRLAGNREMEELFRTVYNRSLRHFPPDRFRDHYQKYLMMSTAAAP